MMNRFVVVLIGACMFGTMFADTIPGGDVSGTWHAANSPYYINGNITVPAGDTLTIEPAVRVNFLGGYYFTVNGWLEAVGTGTDSIYFAGGNRFVFSDAPDISHLVYCSIVTTGPAVECDNSDPVISHSSVDGVVYGIHVVLSSSPCISDCIINNTGVGIYWNANTSGTVSGCTINYCDNGGVRKEAGNLTLTGCIIDNCDWSGVYNRYGNLTLIGCTISDDTVTAGPGGGVRSNGDTLNLIDCTISGNYAYSASPYTDGGGGGVYCENGTVTLTNCTISRNGAVHTSGTQIGGGGIGLRNVNATLSHCTIFDNYGALSGGGIETNNSSSHSLIIDHCTIDRNWSALSWPGNGIRIIGSTSTADVTNSIISNNYGQGEYAIYNEGTLTVEYSDFYGNDSTDIGGNIPTGFGIHDTTNYNGDSCDCYYDLFMDPVYADTANRDFHLTAGSPCIDAGDPAFAYDPDGTVSDIGAYWFDQGSGVSESQVVKRAVKRDFLCATIFSGPLVLPKGKVCRVFDITGRTVIPDQMKPGVYFIQIESEIAGKIIKVK